MAEPELTDLIVRWTRNGIITADQADDIRADLRALEESGTTRGPSIVAETLGYLGGAIVLAGLGLLLGLLWGDLSSTARLAFCGLVTAVLVGAGAAIPPALGAAGVRLRAVLWLAGVGAWAALLGLLADDGFGWSGDGVLLFASVGAVALGGALWSHSKHVLQQIAVAVAVAFTAGSAVAILPGGDDRLPVLAAWVVGLAWFARSPVRLIGAVIAEVAACFLLGSDWGTPLALVTVLVLTAAATLLRDLPLLATAAVATLIVVPVAIGHWFDGVLAPAVGLVAVGTLLIGAGVVTVRRNNAEES